MKSLEQLNKYIEWLYNESLTRYKKFNNSSSYNDKSREDIAKIAYYPSLEKLILQERLSESEINLVMREVTNALIRSSLK